MDKLKQNSFWIAVGATGLVLAALTWFLVIDKLFQLDELGAEIEKTAGDLQRTLKKEFLPLPEYKEYLQEKLKADMNALTDGVTFYEAQGKAFDRFFDDQEVAPDPATFSARYVDLHKDFVLQYRTKFGIRPVEGQPEEQQVPVVSRIEVLDEQNVPRAMKELWIVEEIFRASTKLEIGGLKLIKFEARSVTDKDAAPYHGILEVQVDVEMPFSMMENFLTEVFSSPRVPFLVKDITMQKPLESVTQHVKMPVVKKYKEAADADKDDFRTLVPEPVVLFNLKLDAVDWKGIPVEAEPEPEADKPARTKKRPPPKTRNQ
ncbi:MAG TPA: hypothetical protein VMT52_17535 [Planctomycetota bacterium]|nr:hypothetical protein [Planctomycetota bacterium]